jgi:outer membrane protein assembly factor BamE (lipoprotein component of BamABCDE complex)
VKLANGRIDTRPDAYRLCRTMVLAVLMLLTGASCSQHAPAAILDANKVAAVVVGSSSRTDVFTALGRPTHTEHSAQGEAWIYQAKTGGTTGRSSLMSGATAASSLVGAVVPYVGLVGSGLGLANAAADGAAPEQQVVSLTVTFGDDGLVRDCTYDSTAPPTGMPGSDAGITKPVDCQRPMKPSR